MQSKNLKVDVSTNAQHDKMAWFIYKADTYRDRSLCVKGAVSKADWGIVMQGIDLMIYTLRVMICSLVTDDMHTKAWFAFARGLRGSQRLKGWGIVMQGVRLDDIQSCDWWYTRHSLDDMHLRCKWWYTRYCVICLTQKRSPYGFRLCSRWHADGYAMNCKFVCVNWRLRLRELPFGMNCNFWLHCDWWYAVLRLMIYTLRVMICKAKALMICNLAIDDIHALRDLLAQGQAQCWKVKLEYKTRHKLVTTI